MAQSPTETGPGAVSIALLYPELLGTYGDGGNAAVLTQRLRWRGFGVQLVEVPVGDPPPASADIYLLGGGEDGPQTLALDGLKAAATLQRAVDDGAAVLAVCAGFQLLGSSFVGPDGRPRDGLGILDCQTRRGQGPRRVGEIVVEPTASLGLPALTGYENHGCDTILGASASPLGRVVVGHGNAADEARSASSDGYRTEGCILGSVIGTYLHGPVLARNPALADRIAAAVVGELATLDDSEVDALRAERLAQAQRPSASSTIAWARRWRRQFR